MCAESASSVERKKRFDSNNAISVCLRFGDVLKNGDEAFFGCAVNRDREPRIQLLQVYFESFRFGGQRYPSIYLKYFWV